MRTTKAAHDSGRFYEVTGRDIGKATLRAFGRTWLYADFMGRPLPQDVGKRVYLRGDILQVENDAQRAERLSAAV